MKTSSLFAAALMTVASAGAFADSLYYSTNTTGNTTYYSGDVSGYSYRIGNTTYHNINGGSISSNNIDGTLSYVNKIKPVNIFKYD